MQKRKYDIFVLKQGFVLFFLFLKIPISQCRFKKTKF